MGIIGAVALGVVLVAVAVGAAAWDRTHGRKNETWESWQTLPVWTYPLMAVAGIAMVVSNIADRNWFGVAASVGLIAFISVGQLRQRRRAPK